MVSNDAAASAAAAASKSTAPQFGIMWTVMRSIGDMSLPFFFRTVHIQDSKYVPPSGVPLILCSTHANTILDVAILSSHMPERRPLHFWAKSGLFHNPIARFILNSSGNIKVDRRKRNNQALFRGSFDAMTAGGVIALFPEGGSYSRPALTPLKPGAAWAALEYARSGIPASRSVQILPAAVVYSDKSRFRSSALLVFAKPITLDPYVDQFLSSPVFPGDPDHPQQGEHPTPAQAAVARLTADLQAAMQQITFNAPDWETYHAVKAARELIWPDDDHDLDMARFVPVSNALLRLVTLDKHTDHHQPAQAAQASKQARLALFQHACMLALCDVRSGTLTRLLERSSGKAAGAALVSSLTSFAVRLPYLVPIFGPTLVPVYLLPSWIANYFAGKEEESLSSVKTLTGFGFSLLLYGTALFRVMQWTRWTPPGFLLGVIGVWWSVELNRSCVDHAYDLVRQLKLSWRLWRSSATYTLFFYGTLVHPPILARVIGRDASHLTIRRAHLAGHTLCHIRGEDYPALVTDSDAASIGAPVLGGPGVPGALVSGLTAADVARLDAFEGTEYARRRVRVQPDSHSEPVAAAAADVYAWTAGLGRLEPLAWSFDAFARDKAAHWAGPAASHEYTMIEDGPLAAVEAGLRAHPNLRYTVRAALRGTGRLRDCERISALLASREAARRALERVAALCPPPPEEGALDGARWPFETRKER